MAEKINKAPVKTPIKRLTSLTVFGEFFQNET